MRVALGHATVLADHALAVLDRNSVSLGKRLRRAGHVLSHHVHALKNPAYQVGDNVRMVAIEIIPHRPHVGDEMVRAAGGDDEPRAGDFVGHGVNVRRPAHERVERLILHKDLRRCRRVSGPFEVHLSGVNAGVNQQRHDEVMARRVLRQHDLAALPVLHPKIVDVTQISARDDAVAAARPVNLLGDDRHGARVLHQLRREQRHHVERAPQDMAVAAGEQVAGLDRIVHD